MARKPGNFLLLRLTASASTIDVAGERIGIFANSASEARAEPQREKTMLSIVLMLVVLLGFSYPTNDLAPGGHFFATERLR
jgi:hypothetical protein